MTPDEIIEVLQGFKAGRKWGYGMSVSGSLVESADQSVKALIANISLGFEVALMPLPDEITIPARVISAPLREAPAVGTPYYVVSVVDEENFCFESCWGDDGADYGRLARGLVYLDEGSAMKAGKAMCPYA